VFLLENEKEVGQGIAASGIPRNELFITTKLDNSDQRNPGVALTSSLEKLGVGYLDLWLMHWVSSVAR
jgi:glycerol 2-dehydrogenase (NADP+)